MVENCCSSMEHYEHMCSLNLNGCAIEHASGAERSACAPCGDAAHNHRHICTPSLIAA